MRKAVMILAGFLIIADLYSQQGNIGIGLSNPTRAKLEIEGAVGTNVAIFGGDGQGISIQRGFPSIGFNQYYDGVNSRYISNGYAAVQWFNPNTGTMHFDLFPAGTANAIASPQISSMYIDNAGRIGIGATINPDARVTVGRGTGNDGTAVFRGSVYSSHFNFSTEENTYIRGGKANSYVYINKADNIGGNRVYFGGQYPVKIGINSGNPVSALEMRQVNGRGMIFVNNNSASWHFNVGAATAQGSYMQLYYNEGPNPVGSFHPQTGAYAAVSDARLKQHILPLENVSFKLNKLRPVRYAMVHAPGQQKQPGFIAQELAQQFPDLVTVAKDSLSQGMPGMHLLNYDGLAVYAIQTIREQQLLIESLEAKLIEIKKLLFQLKN